MCALRKPEVSASLSFDVWKSELRHDCELRDKLRSFDAMGDYVLRFLWERGLDPTVQAIIEDDPTDHLNKSVWP